jgi:hypothetical protein
MFSSQMMNSVTTGIACKNARTRDLIRQRRREKVWAWLTLVTLILCWDASIRLDERVSPPRVRTDHVGEAADAGNVSVRRR